MNAYFAAHWISTKVTACFAAHWIPTKLTACFAAQWIPTKVTACSNNLAEQALVAQLTSKMQDLH
jgi:hypothetical protein